MTLLLLLPRHFLTEESGSHYSGIDKNLKFMHLLGKMHGDVMWKLGAGCLSFIHEMQRVKVIIRAPQGWWCRAGPSAAAHSAQTPRLRWLWATWAQVRSPVHAAPRRGGCRKAPRGAAFGLQKRVWRGSGCRFTPTVTKLVSPLGQPPPQSPTNRSLITFHHPTCFSPIVCTTP